MEEKISLTVDELRLIVFESSIAYHFACLNSSTQEAEYARMEKLLEGLRRAGVTGEHNGLKNRGLGFNSPERH